jgi:aromatic ring hydroxylase
MSGSGAPQGRDRGGRLQTAHFEASVADEVLVLPTRALRKEDKDYAVAFAVPATGTA